MKHVLNVLLILVAIINPLGVYPGGASVTIQAQAQAAPISQSRLEAAYPPPATPTPVPTATQAAPTPTPQPTAVPTPVATPTPSAPTSRISLKTNLNCVSPEQNLSLDWEFQPSPEWAGRESALELVVSLPAAFTPDSKTWTRFDAQTGTGRLPLSKNGKLQGKLAKEIGGSITIAAKVVSGERVVAETALQLGKGRLFDVAARGGEVADPDSRVRISFPEGALSEDIRLCIKESVSDSTPTVSLSGHAFEINAEGKHSKAAVRQFGSPITITYRYDEGAVAGDGSTLSLVYYNEDTHQWDYLPGAVDTANHQVTGYSTHLTLFDYDVNSIDKYKINDLSVFQVSTFTGAATYSYPLNLPPGPGGFNQSLALTYNSAIPDGASYYTQASWVGMGWDLEAGSITRNTRGSTGLGDDTFSLSFSGGGGMLLPASTGTDSFGHFIEYQTQNINYLRIRMYDARSSSSSEYYQDQSVWRVWDQAGNLYTFGASMPYINYGVLPVQGEIYKWFISSAKSVAGKEYSFNYAKTNVYRTDNVGGNWSGTTIAEMYLDNIQYPDNSYYVHFERKDRQDYSKPCYESVLARCFADKKYLSSIAIYYNPDRDAITHSPNNNPDGAGNADTLTHTGLQQVRKYQLTYAADDGAAQHVFPGVHWQDTAGYVLTLLKIQEKGTSDSLSLPETTFTYDQMHLTEVNNGYNGKVVFEYEPNPWAQDAANFYPSTWNYRDQGMPAASASASYSYGPVNEGSFAPGKQVWLRLGAATRGQSGLTAYTQINLPDGSSVGGPGIAQNMTASTTPQDYYFLITLPANMPKTSGSNQYTLQFWCGGSDPGYRCEMSSVEWGLTPTRYRVTKRKVYPQAVDFANPNNTNLPHDDYSYTYTGAALNPIDASKTLYPTRSDYDYAALRRLSKPYSEFRGHAQVKVTRPDGSILTYNYHQSERLSGQLSSVVLYRGADLVKLSETIYAYTTPIQIPSSGVNDQLPKYRIEPNAYVYLDAQVWWVGSASVEKWTYGETSPIQSVATKSETSYRYDTNGLPIYGEVRSVVESEKNGSNWPVVRKKFLTYTATDVNDSTRYFVGHPSSMAVCSANGSETNAEYQICGTNAGDYYGFTSYTYNTLGQVSEVINLLNFTGAPGTSYTNRYSDYTQYTYDSYGNVVTTGKGYKDQNAAGVVQQTTTSCYKAETSGATPACTDYSGAGVNGVYLSWVKNALNQVTHYRSSAQLGLPTQQIDPNGAVTSVSYDEFGRVAAVRKPGDSEPGLATLQFAYNAPTTAIPYFWTEATQKLGDSGTYTTQRVRKFYNGIGELIQTQQVGVVVSDADCSAPTCTVVANQKSEYVNGVKTTTQAVPYAVATPSGYVALPASPWQNATVTTYDVLGRPLVIKAPGQTDANKQSISYSVDGNPLKTKTSDANGHTTESWKDVWGRTVKVQPHIGPWLEYGYDLANRLTTVKQFPQGGSAEFATTTITYDVAGRKTSMVDPDMGTWSYAYDALSNLTRQTDAKGQRICLYYDALNRLTGKHYRTDNSCPTSSPTLNVSYSYDANTWGKGRRTGMTDLSGTTAWAYDARGRMTSETKTVKDGATVLGTYVTSWTYTSADRMDTMTYPSGETVTSSYLPQGTLTSLTSSYNLTYLSSASVDAAGRPTVFNLGNNTQTVYTYNGWAANSAQSGRLQKLQSGSPDSLSAGTPNLQSFEYTYDWVGNITKIIQRLAGSTSDETLNYGYDEINRLAVEANSVNPAYDANTGNLTSKGGKILGYGPQAADCPGGALSKVHAATSLDGTANTYCYDANGNMTRRKMGTDGYELAYDSENRLITLSKTLPAPTPPNQPATVNYVYDGDGQRVLVKQPNGDKIIYIGAHFEVFIKAGYTSPATPPARNCGAMRCIFVPSAPTLATSPAPTGQMWKSYYSTGSGRALRVQDNTNTGGSSGIFWLYADHLGSTTVTARMDAIGGDLLSTLSYTAWGETRASSGTTPTSLRYTGQREAEAGLYFYQARWYDPALGRFAQADSVIPGSDAISFDRYSYVRNNPVNFNDPSGHYACGDGIDDPRCQQGDPIPDSTPSTPTTIVDQFGGLFGNGAQVLNIADTWFDDHPNYDLYNDTSVWTVYNGQPVPRVEYEQLVLAYGSWRVRRGQSDLLGKQMRDQALRFIGKGYATTSEIEANRGKGAGHASYAKGGKGGKGGGISDIFMTDSALAKFLRVNDIHPPKKAILTDPEILPLIKIVGDNPDIGYYTVNGQQFISLRSRVTKDLIRRSQVLIKYFKNGED